MKIRCEYCDSFISDTDEKCPFCGAPNGHLARAAAGIPKTIEELRAFAQVHNLPLEKMRFFLGEDYRGAKAYGIFKDENGDFIVYKNKANGERAVRYRGKDEAYAVNELWQKMRSEIQTQRAHQTPRSTSAAPVKIKKNRTGLYILAAILAFLFLSAVFDENKPDRGYYSYGDSYYYYDTSDWYVYDAAADDWEWANIDDGSPLYSDYEDYYTGSYSDGADYESFYDSDYYADHYEYPDSDSGSGLGDWFSDWDDSDWDWDDSDSWDSDSSDWDSDW